MYRGRFGIIAGLRRALGRRAGRARAHRDLKGAYVRHVETMRATTPGGDAMAVAIGGAFDQIGAVESALLRRYGLPVDGYVIDVGCGSGRLAKPLSDWLEGRYLGIDLVPALLKHARALVPRPDWRFEEVDHIAIPEADGQADMVVFFSVLTHLLHEQSYWYLEEARRVLKPGGRIIFSFLEFKEPHHWRAFHETIDGAKHNVDTHLNVFMDRDWIPIWADHLDLIVEDVRTAADPVVPEGHLGQAFCVLRKP
jgi:SAM-dependent methyltransferase